MPPTLIWLYLAAAALGSTYALLIAILLQQWKKLPDAASPNASSESVFLSVVIPARNEAASIRACLNSIFRQRFPAGSFEVIVVDDHSTDETAAIVNEFDFPNLRLLRLEEHLSGTPVASYKKKALELAVADAKGPLIVTTDADCLVPPGWLAQLSACYQESEPVAIAGPVGLYGEDSPLDYFQSLDVLGTMVLTGAGIFSGRMHLANGAHFAFAKEAFQIVGGYKNIDHLASGDDMLLMQKLAARFPNRIRFLKSPLALVRTKPQPDLPSFFQQRLRWATKTTDYPEPRVTRLWMLVFLLCWAILLSPLLVFSYGYGALGVSFLLLSLKSLADYALLRRACLFFNRPKLMRHFAISQFMHILYVALIGLAAIFREEYEWKGRNAR